MKACLLLVFQYVVMPLNAWAWQGVVTHVSDGDTVWVRALADGYEYKVRLLGIDAPEICQVWGPQSRAALHAAVDEQLVEVTGNHHDSYGRLLAQLSRQGQDVGAWMVLHGYAWSYRYQKRAGLYDAQQQYAQSLRLGLFAGGQGSWQGSGQGQPLQPRWFRKRFGSCARAG